MTISPDVTFTVGRWTGVYIDLEQFVEGCPARLYIDLEQFVERCPARPAGDGVWLLQIPALGIEIPWPEDKTAREALDEWRGRYRVVDACALSDNMDDPDL